MLDEDAPQIVREVSIVGSGKVTHRAGYGRRDHGTHGR
jgi:hypothetical protein